MKIAKIILIGLLVLTAILFAIGFIFLKSQSMDLPKGTDPAGADAVAQSMLEALNKPAFDTIPYMKWNFAGRNQYVWDKANNTARVTMSEGNDVVLLDMTEVAGKAFQNGVEITGISANDLVQTAWANWCNDSFWMIAPFKVFDKGTTRTLVDLDEKDGDGRGLLVTYESGGVTPGDSYLWILDEHNIPVAYRMWVSNIPLAGARSSWGNWKTLYNGAMVSLEHDLGILQVKLTDVDAGQSLTDIGLKETALTAL